MIALHARHVLDDPSAYTTSDSLWSLESSLGASVDSGTQENMAHHGWYFHVSLLALPTLWNVTQVLPNSNWAAGSLSPVLTTSGVLSEDIVPTVGRFVYVMGGPYVKVSGLICPFDRFTPLHGSPSSRP
jgi:hypothetical protein